MSHFCSDYSFTKNAGSLAMQLIAGHADPKKLQVVNVHPGVVYSGGWEAAGVPPTILPFDDRECSGLPAGAAHRAQQALVPNGNWQA